MKTFLSLIFFSLPCFLASFCYGNENLLSQIQTEIKSCNDSEKRVELAKIATALRLQKRNQLTPKIASEALMVALKNNQHDVVHLMIPMGATTPVKDKYGFTPLAFACISNNLELVNALIGAGADANEKITLSDRIIGELRNQKLAFNIEPLRMVNVHASRDFPLGFENHFSVLAIAACIGNEKIVQRLLSEKAVVNPKDNDSYPALLCAATNGHTKIAKLLIKNGADANATITGRCERSDSGKRFFETQTALEVAAGENYIEIVDLLFDISSVAARNLALIRAAEDGSEEVVKLLIEKGVDVNAQDKDGDTALMETDKEEIARLLIEAGADVNMQNKDGYSALHGSALRGKPKISELLIDAGADVNAKHSCGTTALMCIGSFCAVDSETTIEHIKLMLESGADVNAKAEWGETALHYFSGSSTTTSLNLLIDAGADVNARTKNGVTPLWNAVEHGKVDNIKLLIKSGADVNTKAKSGETALSFAQKKYNEEGTKKWSEIIRFLKSMGAKE